MTTLCNMNADSLSHVHWSAATGSFWSKRVLESYTTQSDKTLII